MHIFNFHKYILSDFNSFHFSINFNDGEFYSNNFVSVLNPFTRPTASRVFGQNTSFLWDLS